MVNSFWLMGIAVSYIKSSHQRVMAKEKNLSVIVYTGSVPVGNANVLSGGLAQNAIKVNIIIYFVCTLNNLNHK